MVPEVGAESNAWENFAKLAEQYAARASDERRGICAECRLRLNRPSVRPAKRGGSSTANRIWLSIGRACVANMQFVHPLEHVFCPLECLEWAGFQPWIYRDDYIPLNVLPRGSVPQFPGAGDLDRTPCMFLKRKVRNFLDINRAHLWPWHAPICQVSSHPESHSPVHDQARPTIITVGHAVKGMSRSVLKFPGAGDPG